MTPEEIKAAPEGCYFARCEVHGDVYSGGEDQTVLSGARLHALTGAKCTTRVYDNRPGQDCRLTAHITNASAKKVYAKHLA